MSEGMMSNLERLVYMANQIARNFAAMGHDEAAAATADHLLQFWDPRMKAQIIARAAEADSGLSETAAEAVALMARDTHAGDHAELPVRSAVHPMGGSDAG